MGLGLGLGLASPNPSPNPYPNQVRLIDCVLLYAHGPFFALLFGFAPELTEPLLRGARSLYGKLYGREYGRAAPQPVRRMPRSFSGIW